MKQAFSKPGEIDLTQAAHPIVCLIHIGLKVASILCYLFMRLITSSSINTFITVLLLNSIDFWFVKNVAGRYLVGLRWWNGDDDSGDEGWVWEHDNHRMKRNDADIKIFWTGMVGNAVFWLVLGIVKFIGFSLFWGMLVIINFFMAFTNLYAYYQCNQEYKSYVDKMVGNLQQFGRASANLVNAVFGNEDPNKPVVVSH